MVNRILSSFLFLFFLFSPGVKAQELKELKISSAIIDNSKLSFMKRKEALALNVHYEDIKFLRSEIGRTLNKTLTFFKGWNKKGEAHVTTITPPEYINQLSAYISEEEMNKIADSFNIQSADIKVLGIGSGKKNFNGDSGETFFIIVQSEKLLKIRMAIYEAYLKKGGPKSGPHVFRPEHFYPHITIGFTHQDIHESDGLLKDVEHSLDKRFKLIVK